MNIDVVYPANSLINRTISGALYEVHLNAIGIFIRKSVMSRSITPQKLYDTVKQIYAIIGKVDAFEKSDLTPDGLFKAIELFEMKWGIRPYDEFVTVETMDRVTALAEEVFGFKKMELMNGQLEISDDHIVGKMFMMRLMHDRMHIVAGSSIPGKDSRGHLIDKSTAKKDGRSLHGDKPTKLCILTIDKILKSMSNESVSVIFKDKEPQFGTHELTECVGFKFESTKKIKNRQVVEEEEND